METLSIENQEAITLEEFLSVNEDLSPKEILDVKTLEISERCFIGLSEVKRVS